MAATFHCWVMRYLFKYTTMTAYISLCSHAIFIQKINNSNIFNTWSVCQTLIWKRVFSSLVHWIKTVSFKMLKSSCCPGMQLSSTTLIGLLLGGLGVVVADAVCVVAVVSGGDCVLGIVPHSVFCPVSSDCHKPNAKGHNSIKHSHIPLEKRRRGHVTRVRFSCSQNLVVSGIHSPKQRSR